MVSLRVGDPGVCQDLKPDPNSDIFLVGSEAGSGSGCFKGSKAESGCFLVGIEAKYSGAFFWLDLKTNPDVFLVGSKAENGCFFGRI